MKTKYTRKIGDHTIISHISDAAVDTETTRRKISAMVVSGMSEMEIEQLFMDNLVYAKVDKGAENIADEEATQIEDKLLNKGKNRLVLNNGEYISDYMETEYYIKKSGKWKKEKIEDIGIDLPGNAVLQENLTPEQLREIYEQSEEERKTKLTPEEKAQERIMEINRELADIDAKQARSSAEIAEAFIYDIKPTEETVNFHLERQRRAAELREERKDLCSL